MQLPAISDQAARTFRILALAGLGLALGLFALWAWAAICEFPVIPWNDMRLAPSIAWARGLPVYGSGEAGPINTWVYGPLPFLFLIPAALAPSPATALLVAGVLNLALVVVPVVLVGCRWPASPGGADAPARRSAAVVLALAAWPGLFVTTLFSDTLAIALGLCANLVLIRARAEWQFWLAATAASAAVGCKQIALGIPLAQAIWVGVTAGGRAGLFHALRCAVAGAVLLLAAVAAFGAAELRFTLFELVGSYGWAASLVTRVQATGWAIPVHVGIPILAAVIGWRQRHRLGPTLFLPYLAWLCTLPAGIAGLLYGGGWTNSIYSFVLWLPPAAATLMTLLPEGRRQTALALATAVGAVALLGARLAALPEPTLVPRLAERRQADAIAARFPDGAWFPLHPLVTLYSDGRYYHDDDGLYVHNLGRGPINPARLQSGMPPAMRVMVFSNDWNDWGIAKRQLPPQTRTTVLQYWTIIEGVAGPGEAAPSAR
jgi:hypothetical protein